MTRYTHGGDIYGIPMGETLLDYSINLNPLGMPREVALAAIAGIQQSNRYPDPYCRELIHKIAVVEGIDSEYVLCGNGAADIIFRLVLAIKPKLALVTAPTFSEYENALNLVECSVLHHLLKEEHQFDLTEELLEQITPELDILFLCNPNNPTGRLISQDLLEKIVQHCVSTNTILVVDECFIALSDMIQSGLSHQIVKYPNLILLRAFTKSYAMAGLRLGYCLTSDVSLIEDMRRCTQPWAVSTPSQMAGLAALDMPEWTEKARDLLQVERPFLMERMIGLGLHVIVSQCNFILFSSMFDLSSELQKKGILIRSCSDYLGLNIRYYRVCIGTREQNMMLLNGLKEVQEWQKQL